MSAEASWGFVGFLGLGFGRDLRDDVRLLVSVGGKGKEEDKHRRVNGWRDGGMEGWRDGGVEGWRGGRMEGWRGGGEG